MILFISRSQLGKTTELELRISDRDDGHNMVLDLNASNAGLCNS